MYVCMYVCRYVEHWPEYPFDVPVGFVGGAMECAPVSCGKHIADVSSVEVQHNLRGRLYFVHQRCSLSDIVLLINEYTPNNFLIKC